MILTPEFPCHQCGACCRHVDRASQTQFLDRGDGICRYYQTETKLCSVYETRPLICQVEKQYMLNYQQEYSWQEFITLNREACLILEKLEQPD